MLLSMQLWQAACSLQMLHTVKGTTDSACAVQRIEGGADTCWASTCTAAPCGAPQGHAPAGHVATPASTPFHGLCTLPMMSSSAVSQLPCWRILACLTVGLAACVQ